MNSCDGWRGKTREGWVVCSKSAQHFYGIMKFIFSKKLQDGLVIIELVNLDL
jgi:hypothetical protein